MRNMRGMPKTERETDTRELRGLIDGMPGGVGIYHYYPGGEMLEQVYLNNGYYSLINARREDRREYNGLLVKNAMPPEDFRVVLGEIKRAISENGMINVDVRVKVGYAQHKWLNIRASVAEKTDDRVTLYAFYSDIDRLKTTQLLLEANRRVMQVASSAAGISFWLYDIDEKRITMEFRQQSPLNYPLTIDNAPDYMLSRGYVAPEDVPEYLRLYRELDNGAETCECTIRKMNLATDKMEWRRIIYTRLHDDAYKGRCAIGFAMNADFQQQMRVQYEHELQLRRELIRDCVIYFQLNLTKGCVEESLSRYESIPFVTGSTPITEELRAEFLSGIDPAYHDAVRKTLFSDALMDMYRRGKTYSSLIYRRHIPGEGSRWLKTAATIMKQPGSGDIIAFIYSRDIDDDKKNQLAIESMMDEEIESIAVINVKSGMARLVKVSAGLAEPGGHKPFGYDARMRDILEKNAAPEDAEEYKRFFSVEGLLSTLEREQTAKLTFRIMSGDGRVMRKKARAFFLDDTREDIILIRRDITDLYEEEQRQKKALRRAVDTANAANQAKSAFLSRMSHDMRTPLNAILALSGPEMTESANQAQKDIYLQKIHSSGEYLLGIINDVLDMSRIESKKLTLSMAPYALDDFVNTINTVIGEQCKQKDITFRLSMDAPVKWLMLDKVRFNQIFINLLSNAVKFTPEGGEVELSIQNLSVCDERVLKRFTVRDNGIGMSESFLPHAFDSFAQENNGGTSQNDQGTGLGLAIVKQLVELMGGEISVESSLGQGTTFTVDLPVTIAGAAREPETPRADLSRLSGMRILLCEDHPLNAHIATTLLIGKGCRVELAENGELGLRMFERSAHFYYDLILMDIRMPVMGGIAATGAIRALERPDAKTVPIIAMTADAFTEDVQVSLGAGMNGHLSKPIDPELLYETVASKAPKTAE